MIKKISTKFSKYLFRRENEATYKGFIAGIQYAEWLAKREGK